MTITRETDFAMQEIKAVIFDAGGVLLDGNFPKFLQIVEKELGLKPVKDIAEEGGAIVGREMGLGHQTAADCLNELYGGKLSKEKHEKLLKVFEQEWPQNKKMIELAQELKKRYKVALLSNTEDIHSKRMRKEGFVDLFDEAILSNEVHLLKPEKPIYLLILEKLRVKAGQCVFIDDIEENTETAEKLGFKTILFKSREQCINELNNFGIDI